MPTRGLRSVKAETVDHLITLGGTSNPHARFPHQPLKLATVVTVERGKFSVFKVADCHRVKIWQSYYNGGTYSHRD